MASEETRPAGDVEGEDRLETRDYSGELVDLLLPAGSVPVGIETPSEPPVVVLQCAPVVVRLHSS
jgi:hypothetical protein